MIEPSRCSSLTLVKAVTASFPMRGSDKQTGRDMNPNPGFAG